MVSNTCNKRAEENMTPKFDDRKDSRQQKAGELDSCQRSRFEMLSAFLDGELAASERQQVQEWLANDSQFKRQYRRLMKLRQGIQTLPVPQSEQSAFQIAQQVLARLERLRTQQLLGWGGMAVAALFIGALSNVLPGNHPLGSQVAHKLPSTSHETLMVALNAPPIRIPKPAVASPDKFLPKSGMKIQKSGQKLEAGYN
jgi:hypothetical protein